MKEISLFCAICETRFAEKSYLLGKRFKCAIFDTTVAQKTEFNSHMALAHETMQNIEFALKHEGKKSFKYFEKKKP